MSHPGPEMVGTALTAEGWRTYYVTPDGNLLVHLGDTATGTDAPPLLAGHYDSVQVARAVARHRLRCDVAAASDDVRLPCLDLASLTVAESGAPLWALTQVLEAPVTELTAIRSLPDAIRA